MIGRWSPFITRRAVQPAGCRLHVLPALGASRVVHVLSVPRGACPVSRNPLGGSVRITYRPRDVVAEIVSLDQLVKHGARVNPGQARSVEGLGAWLHGELVRALGVEAELVLTVEVMPGPQSYEVRFE